MILSRLVENFKTIMWSFTFPFCEAKVFLMCLSWTCIWIPLNLWCRYFKWLFYHFVLVYNIVPDSCVILCFRWVPIKGNDWFWIRHHIKVGMHVIVEILVSTCFKWYGVYIFFAWLSLIGDLVKLTHTNTSIRSLGVGKGQSLLCISIWFTLLIPFLFMFSRQREILTDFDFPLKCDLSILT